MPSFDYLFVRPFHALAEIIGGIRQAAPHLVGAVKQAVMDAVESRLSATARQEYRQGVGRVVAGIKKLPAAVIFTGILCLYPVIRFAWRHWAIVLALAIC